jgi:hypothetical protein
MTAPYGSVYNERRQGFREVTVAAKLPWSGGGPPNLPRAIVGGGETQKMGTTIS